MTELSQSDDAAAGGRAVIPASGGDALRGALERAVALTGPELRRVGHADTSVAFTVTGRPEAAATLVLDRHACHVVGGGTDAEVEIVLTAEQADAFAAGRLPMTAAVVADAVGVAGPVRRYLEVDIVLRRLLELGAEGPAAPRPAAGPPAARSGPIDADLLAIETRGLHKSFGANTVLAGLDLTIPEGVIAVILGPSGTGKSVCLQHIIGLMAPDAGDVVVRGRPLGDLDRTELLRLRRDIGVMFQDGALFSTMDVYDNVAFPLREHTDFSEPDIRLLVEDQLERVGLAAAGRRMPHELSGGMRKRAGLARAMVLNPGIVLCDEPDSGLDPVRTALLGDLLLDRHAEHGGTMIVVTHNVSLARSIADHISVLWRGRVLESGMAGEILASDTPFIRQFLAGEPDGPLSMDA
jgi:phospholipid/cholesterol/gamma-HCH transport system ATP-binding protein